MSDAVLKDGCLKAETVVVTGAGSGLGRAIALRLLGLGARVIGIGRRAERLEETGALAGNHSGRYAVQALDVRDEAAITEAAKAIGEKHDVTALVNNAGGQFVAPATEISRRGWNSVIDLNLTAVFRLCQLFQPALAKSGGAIVNISLSPIERGAIGMAHGVAARAGVLGLTKSLALEWAEQGIRVNCIGPGSVATAGLDDEVSAETRPRLVAGIPLGRLTRPEEVAEFVGYLISPAGRMISGQMLQIDGLAHLGAPVDLLPR
ncbi:SDR family oxidoreductase [Ferrovibrio sp. MS7]|uniref:SDR family NAD(P)-dependent oxidoreductase n=1 Tax=Ferrovibrio plantarum TaxID=3119164 RepID=UPI0031347249